jgi:hypothetical protein
VAFVEPVVPAAPAARAPEAAAGAALLAAASAAADCATAGADMASVAVMTHKAQEARTIPLDADADRTLDRNADAGDIPDISNLSNLSDLSDPSNNRDTFSDRKDGNGDRRETKREPRRLRDKEIGNVVNGQRNMPEILSPCG